MRRPRRRRPGAAPTASHRCATALAVLESAGAPAHAGRAYAAAVVHAAAAAAQHERDGTAGLARARRGPGPPAHRQPAPWPLPFDVAEGELWITVRGLRTGAGGVRAGARRRAVAGGDAWPGPVAGPPRRRRRRLRAVSPARSTLVAVDRPDGAVARRSAGLPAAVPMTVRYAATVLEALAAHGLRPRPETPPRALRDAVNDLYRYEIRLLRDRCRAGEFPSSELAAHVRQLRRRYLLRRRRWRCGPSRTLVPRRALERLSIGVGRSFSSAWRLEPPYVTSWPPTRRPNRATQTANALECRPRISRRGGCRAAARR